MTSLLAPVTDFSDLGIIFNPPTDIKGLDPALHDTLSNLVTVWNRKRAQFIALPVCGWKTSAPRHRLLHPAEHAESRGGGRLASESSQCTRRALHVRWLCQSE